MFVLLVSSCFSRKIWISIQPSSLLSMKNYFFMFVFQFYFFIDLTKDSVQNKIIVLINYSCSFLTSILSLSSLLLMKKLMILSEWSRSKVYRSIFSRNLTTTLLQSCRAQKIVKTKVLADPWYSCCHHDDWLSIMATHKVSRNINSCTKRSTLGVFTLMATTFDCWFVAEVLWQQFWTFAALLPCSSCIKQTGNYIEK